MTITTTQTTYLEEQGATVNDMKNKEPEN